MILGRGTQCASKWPCRLYDDRDLVRKRAQDAIDRCLAIDPESTQTLLWEWYLLPPFGQFLEQQRLMDRLMKSSGHSGAARFLLSRGFSIRSRLIPATPDNTKR